MTSLKQLSNPDLTAVLEETKVDLRYRFNSVNIGIIESFDASDQTASVRVAIKLVQNVAPEGTKFFVEHPVLQKCPVVFPSGGGFTLTFPVNAGDECVVFFNDRELDNWLQNGGVQAPSSTRAHDISDAIVMVGIRSNPRKLGGVSTDTTQLRSDDGNTYVEVAGGGIVNVVAPTGMTFTTPSLTVSGIINVLNENLETSAFNIDGDLRANGDIIADADNTEISLQHHVHSGVQSGPSNTGQPVP